MSEDAISLTRRRVLGSLATVGIAGSAVGAGTTAYFSDTEANTHNAVQAGTLDLTLDGGDQTVTFLDEDGIRPGDSGYKTVELGNVGSITGTIEIVVDEIRGYENGITNKESQQSDTSRQEGELQNHLYVRAEIDADPIMEKTRLAYVQNGYTHTTSETIGPGTSRVFGLLWEFRDTTGDTVNEAQSDSVELDVTFRLIQNGGS